ncbi:MAG: dihydroorotase [Venatoribacter sp.]
MSTFAILNARLLDPSSQLDTVQPLVVENGRIRSIGAEVPADISQRIDAQGQWLIPGLIDLGANLGSAGNLASEAKAALLGGFTHVCALPDASPMVDNAAAAQVWQEKINKTALAKILPLGALTQGLAGEQLASMVGLMEAGCVALSNARAPFKNSYVLRRVMEYAATYDIPIFLAPDDASLSGSGCMHEGKVATRLGLVGVPRSAETIALSQALLLIQQTGVRAHISQISCERSLLLLKRAREDGLNVTADTPLANLIYTDEDVIGFNSQFNVRPVLRSNVDRLALLQAVNSGELAISSNHRPHDVAEKKSPFPEALPGMSMFDGFLPLALTLVEKGELSLTALLNALTALPAQVLGLEQGFKVGNEFNALLYQPNTQHRYRRSELASKGRNSPLAGLTLKGEVQAAFVVGKQVI